MLFCQSKTPSRHARVAGSSRPKPNDKAVSVVQFAPQKRHAMRLRRDNVQKASCKMPRPSPYAKMPLRSPDTIRGSQRAVQGNGAGPKGYSHGTGEMPRFGERRWGRADGLRASPFERVSSVVGAYVYNIGTSGAASVWKGGREGWGCFAGRRQPPTYEYNLTYHTRACSRRVLRGR